jgi:hypothetical protein
MFGRFAAYFSRTRHEWGAEQANKIVRKPKSRKSLPVSMADLSIELRQRRERDERDRRKIRRREHERNRQRKLRAA